MYPSTTSVTTDQTIVKPTSDSSSKPNEVASSSWRSKIHIHHSSPVEPGKEKWRDATLSDKERWKDWQKAKDKEQKRGSTAGAFTEFYKAKGAGKWGYWLDASV